MKKKISLLGLILILVLSFTGCGKSETTEYDQATLEQYAEFVVQNFEAMTTEQLDSFSDMRDLQLDTQLMNAGLPVALAEDPAYTFFCYCDVDYVTFHTTADAMAMAKACKAEEVPGRLIPVPRVISAGCGLAWAAPLEAVEQIKHVMQEKGIEREELHECMV